MPSTDPLLAKTKGKEIYSFLELDTRGKQKGKIKEEGKKEKGGEEKWRREGRGARKGIKRRRERQLRVTGGITNDSKSLYTNKRNELFEAYTRRAR